MINAGMDQSRTLASLDTLQRRHFLKLTVLPTFPLLIAFVKHPLYVSNVFPLHVSTALRCSRNTYLVCEQFLWPDAFLRHNKKSFQV